MRTTIAIDDDVLHSVKSYAEGRSISLGKAITELVRRGLEAPLRTRAVNGFLVVDLPSDSPVVRTIDVRRLEEDLP